MFKIKNLTTIFVYQFLSFNKKYKSAKGKFLLVIVTHTEHVHMEHMQCINSLQLYYTQVLLCSYETNR